MTTVVIADDQVLVRDGLRALVDREPDLEVVAEAADGVEAVELVKRHQPDVVLMDIRMPRLDGLAATRAIGAAGLATKVLVLTTFDRDEWVYEALRAGASGFLLKDVTAARLTDAIRTIAAGEALVAPSIVRRLIEQFVQRTAISRPSRPPDVLTGREVEVLRLVAAGLSNAEIAERLFVAVATVKSHVNRILVKLDLRDRTQVVVYAYETGLVVRGEAGPAPTGGS